MKRSITTTTGNQSRFLSTLFVLALFAAAILLAAPSPTRGDIPGATMINVVCPTNEELQRIITTGGVLPEWAKIIMNKTLDDNLMFQYPNGPRTRVSLYAQFINIFKRNPFYTPDGKWIVFDDRNRCAWKVPVSGGEPQLVGTFDPTYRIVGTTLDATFIGGVFGLASTSGLSLDGKEIIATFNYSDPTRGKVFSSFMSPGPDGTPWPTFSVSWNVTRVVARNIETGQNRLLADDALYGRFSHNGRWFAYVKRDPNKNILSTTWDDYYAMEGMITGLYLKDMSTGTERMISPLAVYPCFTPDDAAILCGMKDSNGLWQIFSVPIEGGSPKQITFYGPKDTGRNARMSDVSPDGKWVLHTGDFNVGDSVKTELFVCNLVSGISYSLFPGATVTATEGTWSPDGKKFIFSGYDPKSQTNNITGYSIFIADFKPDVFVKPTAVAEALPADFAIFGNYPNPFNPSTTISFSLPETGFTNLVVYNASGQKVRELASGTLSAGNHSVVWDGRDQNGGAVSSGVYISRLTMRDKVTANRMLLVK